MYKLKTKQRCVTMRAALCRTRCNAMRTRLMGGDMSICRLQVDEDGFQTVQRRSRR